jgi:nucleoid-associated protein YgaU
VSLSAHLTAGTAEHGRLAFHPDCPRCRAERLAGSLAADSLVSRRAQAVLAAGLLAFSAGAPSAAAQVPPDQQQEPAPPPGLEPEFDPGGEDTFDYDAAPVPGGPEAGGQEDEGLGPPVETEPTTDPDADLLLEEESPAPAPPAAEPIPAPAPELAPAPDPVPPPAPTTPVPPPAEPPAAELELPAPQHEQHKTSTKRKTPERGPETHEVERRPAIGTSPAPPPGSLAPVPQSPAPAVQPVSAADPPATVPGSQPTEPAGGPITGRSYTVRAGDSLWSIARRILGPDASAGRIGREVNRIWELNRERIGTGNPNLIHVGTVLEL